VDTDTKPTDDTVLGTDRQWTDSGRQQWTQNQQTVQCEVLTANGQTVEDRSGHKTNGRYSVRYLRTVDRLQKTAEDTVTQNQHKNCARFCRQ